MTIDRMIVISGYLLWMGGLLYEAGSKKPCGLRQGFDY